MIDLIFENIQKAGIFGGIVLIPLSLAIQYYSMDSFIIGAIGFIVYIAGILIFGKKEIEQAHVDFAKAGKFVFGTTFLIATVAATLAAITPGLRTELVTRFTRDVGSHLDDLAIKPNKTVAIPLANADPSIQKMGVIVGVMEERSMRIASLALAAEPFLGTIVDWIDRAGKITFLFSFAVSVIVALLGLFVVPRLPPSDALKSR